MMSAKLPLATAVLLAATLPATHVDAQARPMSRSPEALIEEAMSAAPAEIARDATIMAWPDREGAEPRTLREGTNGWTCFASSPMAVSRGGQDPMCADEAGMGFLTAYIEQREPRVDRLSIIYMLHGDTGASNTDPWATEEREVDDWVVAGPHVMMVVPDATTLDVLPTDPESGGPWVMWSGTPWAHVMVPVEGSPQGSPMRR